MGDVAVGDAILQSVHVPSQDLMACAATNLVDVKSTLSIADGGKVKVISPSVTLSPEVSISTGAKFEVNSRAPMP